MNTELINSNSAVKIRY